MDRPVGELRTVPEGLYVRAHAYSTDSPPPAATDLGEIWLHLPDTAPVPDRLTRAQHGDASPPRRVPVQRHGGPANPWHSPPAPDTAAPAAGGLRWAAGWARDADERHRTVIATGHDPTDGSERRRVRLGPGEVVAFVAMAGHLWMALRRPHGAMPGAPVELIRLAAREGTTETVLPAESVDITEHCWPRSPRPVDAEYQLRAFDGLATRTDRGYGEQLRGCRAELVGDWPDTTVELHCTHADYPDLDLVRVHSLYDELGRQTPPEQAAHDILETVETGQLPPASDAVNGILHI